MARKLVSDMMQYVTLIYQLKIYYINYNHLQYYFVQKGENPIILKNSPPTAPQSV